MYKWHLCSSRMNVRSKHIPEDDSGVGLVIQGRLVEELELCIGCDDGYLPKVPVCAGKGARGQLGTYAVMTAICRRYLCAQTAEQEAICRRYLCEQAKEQEGHWAPMLSHHEIKRLERLSLVWRLR